MDVLIVIVIVAICVYFKAIKPWIKKREEKEQRQMEQYRCEEQWQNEKSNVRKKLETGGVVQACSELIEAYCEMMEEKIFDMHAGGIYIVAPEPQGKYGPKELSVIFRVYYDDYRFRDLLQGKLEMLYIKGTERSRFFECIVPGSAEMERFLVANGVPEILFDQYSTELKEIGPEEVQWTTKIYSVEGIYGGEETLGHYERMMILSEIMKSKYPALKSLIVTSRL